MYSLQARSASRVLTATARLLKLEFTTTQLSCPQARERPTRAPSLADLIRSADLAERVHGFDGALVTTRRICSARIGSLCSRRFSGFF